MARAEAPTGVQGRAAGTAGPVLDCHDLRRRFGRRLAVDGVGFRVDPGETYGLLGPNGAGKTTTVSMICGLLRRDGGGVTVAGAALDRPGRGQGGDRATCRRTSPSTRT